MIFCVNNQTSFSWRHSKWKKRPWHTCINLKRRSDIKILKSYPKWYQLNQFHTAYLKPRAKTANEQGRNLFHSVERDSSTLICLLDSLKQKAVANCVWMLVVKIKEHWKNLLEIHFAKETTCLLFSMIDFPQFIITFICCVKQMKQELISWAHSSLLISIFEISKTG